MKRIFKRIFTTQYRIIRLDNAGTNYAGNVIFAVQWKWPAFLWWATVCIPFPSLEMAEKEIEARKHPSKWKTAKIIE